MFAPMPPTRFVLSPLNYDFKTDRWQLIIAFDAYHYDRYFDVNKSCKGIEDVRLNRDKHGEIVDATIVLKRDFDRHLAYVEIYNAFNYLLMEN